MKCPKHTGIALLSDLLDDEQTAGRPSLAQAAAVIQEALADLVGKGYWACIQLSPAHRKGGKIECLAYVLNRPGRDGGQTEHSKAFGHDLAEVLAGVLRGDHPARR
ncbi:MAG: hypothetical protein AB1450_04855 [Pseudomonadota bacterium]